jgi:hypothetical protein
LSVTTGDGCSRSSVAYRRSISAQSVSAGFFRARVQRRDRRLHLIRPGRAMAHRLVDERQPLGDEDAVPARAILILEEHDVAVAVEPRVGARVLQQHERQEAHDLRLAAEQAQQEAPQANRLVAQRRAQGRSPARRRIALAE